MNGGRRRAAPNPSSSMKRFLLFGGCGVIYRHRSENFLKYKMADFPSLCDALGLIENPMDSEIDSALTVFFLGLG